jgi:hypothetical protein
MLSSPSETVRRAVDTGTGRLLRPAVALNPAAGAFRAVCRGIGEQKRNVLFLFRIEDSPQFVAEIFNFSLQFFNTPGYGKQLRKAS